MASYNASGFNLVLTIFFFYQRKEGDDNFKGDEDSGDDEATLIEQEGKENVDHKKEIEDLKVL